MKGLFIPMLAVVFSMLVIPLSSLKDVSHDKLVEVQASKSDVAYKQDNAKTTIGFDKIKVLKDDKVLQLSTKDYIFGVVAAEMPALYHEEALKAQAVAAYTFACYQKANNANTKYDISADPKTAQCFITRDEAKAKWEEKADEYEQKIDNCISEVEDQWLSFDGKPIFAAYHAISSGVTNASADVWGKDLAYLKSVDSIGDRLANKYLSEVNFSSEELAKKLKDINESSGEAKNYFSDIITTDSGYVKKITYCKKQITGEAISDALGLRSSNFEVSFADGNFKFTVKGYGHGAGMSQTGADYMAQQGSSYKEILLHYYSGVTLEKN